MRVTWRALDLFSGIGGWSLACHRKGIETVAACEIDPWKRAQFARHFPSVRLYHDIQELTAERLRRDGILPIDIVVGSPPCTDISTANVRGQGVDGPESKLYFDAIRLIGEVGPRWCALENSANLRARGSDRVLAALEAEGYTTWPCVVGAVHAGAPHRRLRSWLVGLRVDGRSASDAQGVGCGQGRAGRSDPGASGEQNQLVARQAAERSHSNQRNGRGGPQQIDDNGRELEGGAGVVCPDANSAGLRIEPRRRRGTRGPGPAIVVEPHQEIDTDANGEGQHGVSRHVEVVGWCSDARPDVADSTDGG